MTSFYPWWWVALPVLLLPIWWHRQKRRRPTSVPLATARFLPAAAPQQVRVWQWQDRLLLLVRCLLLITLIGWLAAVAVPWRGDTVLVDAGADRAWAEQQIAAAGMTAARRMELPPAPLAWLHEHERDWRASARLLIVARATQLAMPAHLPQFGHRVELRTAVAPLAAASQPAADVRYIALAAKDERAAAWRALFAAFDHGGDGTQRHVVADSPQTSTELIVWDTPGQAPPAGWRAPHWWLGTGQAWPELARASTVTVNGIVLRYADSPRGRLWTSEAFPPRDADTARTLYQAWRLLAAAPAPTYPAPSQVFAVAPTASTEIETEADTRPANWIALALLALFLLERTLTHARRA